jgi:hypothetical protein
VVYEPQRSIRADATRLGGHHAVSYEVSYEAYFNGENVMATTKMNQMMDLRKQLETNGVDVLQHLIKDTIQQLMAAEVDATCGAAHGVPNEDRVNSRNGFR